MRVRRLSMRHDEVLQEPGVSATPSNQTRKEKDEDPVAVRPQVAFVLQTCSSEQTRGVSSALSE
jgi:hypothetical protein